MHERFGANAKTFLSESWYPRWVLLGCLLLSVAACSGGLDPEPPALDSPTLLVEGSDESTPEALDGSTVSGTIDVYVESHRRISEVQFFLNDPELLGEPKKTIQSEPRLERYVLTLDTTALADGTHTLSVVILVGQGRNNSKVKSEAAFTVDNSSDGSSDLPGEEGDDGAGSGQWQSTDIGAVGSSGSVEYSEAEGAYTLSVASGDIWGEADSFFFTYQELAGDGEITARVTDLDEVHRSSKAGVMIRSSLDAGASHATMYMNVPSRERAALAHRSVDGGETSNATSDAGMPWFVRLVRQGDLVIGYASPDGEDWTEVDSVIIDLPGQVYVGLALSSNDESEVAEAQFDTVAVGDVSSLPSVGIEIDPGSVELGTGETMSFSAEVTGTSDTDVSWSASVGTITADGVYTAPSSPGPDLVTATSKADPDKKDTAEVTVVDSDTSSPPGASGDFSLRGDPNFDESQLSDEARMWYRRVWAAIENPNASYDLESRADEANLRHLGYQFFDHITMLMLAFRATGDLELLDYITHLADILSGELVTQWYDPDTGTWYEPDDGTAGYRRWLYFSTSSSSLDGKDTHRIALTKTHGWIALMAYMFEMNRDLASPNGHDYGAQADFWSDYLLNDFEAIGTSRFGSQLFPYGPSTSSGHSTRYAMLMYWYYTHKLTGESWRADRDVQEASMVRETWHRKDTPMGPALLVSQSFQNPEAGLRPMSYSRYDWLYGTDLALEGHPLVTQEAYEMFATSLAHFIMDNGARNFAFDIGGFPAPGSGYDENNCPPSGTGRNVNQLDTGEDVFMRTMCPYTNSSLSYGRQGTNRFSWSFYTGMAVHASPDARNRIMQVSEEVYADRESDLENPRRMAIPIGMLLSAIAGSK